MTELLLNLLDEDPDGWDLRQDALKAMENVLKEAGGFPNEIRDFMNNLELPPEPPDPKVRLAIAKRCRKNILRKFQSISFVAFILIIYEIYDNSMIKCQLNYLFQGSCGTYLNN